MLSRPQRTLLALLALSSIAQASWLENARNGLVRRQDDLDSSPRPSNPTASPSPESPSASGTPSVSTPTISPPSTTPSVTPSPSDSSTSSSLTPTPSPTPSPTPEESSTSSTRSSTTTSPSVTPSPSVVQVTQTRTVNGSLVTSVAESTSMVTPTPTNSAELNQNNDSSGSGMSSKTRSTVIGVVVGIGGAILLGGLAVVAWRIWGRKKSVDEGDDYDYGRPETAVKESSSSTGGSSNPFQSTLESYHNPAKVNPSANF